MIFTHKYHLTVLTLLLVGFDTQLSYSAGHDISTQVHTATFISICIFADFLQIALACLHSHINAPALLERLGIIPVYATDQYKQ